MRKCITIGPLLRFPSQLAKIYNHENVSYLLEYCLAESLNAGARICLIASHQDNFVTICYRGMVMHIDWRLWVCHDVHKLWATFVNFEVLLPERRACEFESRCTISTVLVPCEHSVPNPPMITISRVPSSCVMRLHVWSRLLWLRSGPLFQVLVSIL